MIEIFPSSILKFSHLLSTRYCTFYFLVLSIFIFSSVVQATTINVPADHSTIQAAIDAASGGDIVLVANGTYTGEGNKNLDFKGKAITVQSENGPENTIIDCENSGRGFYFNNEEGPNSIVSGFTITNGRAVHPDPGGSGIYFGNSTSPTINNCIISNCIREWPGKGSGIFSDNASPTINNCIITGNSATSGGGGIYIFYSSPTINNCTFSDNSARGGAGIKSENSSSTITNCTITGNSATNHGGGISLYSSSPTISKCTISGNSANDYGGGIYSGEFSSPTITGSTINSNTSGDGGGLRFNGSTPTITNSIITENIATNNGGGISSSGSPTITNSTISRNLAGGNGGGMYLSYTSSTIIINSILWGDIPNEIFLADEINPEITYCNIQGGFLGEGNFHGDPMFVDAENGDYHLSVSSPCIYNATALGAPDVDFNGNPRPQGSGYDIGAYEVMGYDTSRPIIHSFTADITETHVPFEVTFICSASDPDGEIASYSIFYDDGSPSQTNSSGIFTHNYIAVGMGYAICSVTDNEGITVNSKSIKIRRYGNIHVPTDYLTIQAAIDAALDGDTVLVADGTYTGEGNKNLDFKGKAITVQSVNGPESTTIDCENNGRGFVFHSGEGNDSILSGFTITKGYGNSGGGISIGSSSNPTIENFIIKDSSASMFGGGIQISSSSPILSDCTIKNNNAGLWGGGMSIHAGSSGPSNPTIHNCKIINNLADSMGGGIYNVNSSTDIINSVISNNAVTSGGSTSGGGGIYFNDDAWGRSSAITNSIIANNYANYGGGIRIRSIISNLTIANSTIAYNSASIAGGGIYAANSYDTFTKITNSIIWGSAPEEIFVDSYSSDVNITYSSISGGWPGEGNINLYPIFVDHAKDDFHLSNFSPCLNAGKVEGVPDDDLDGNPRPTPNGSSPDMGAYENNLAIPEIPTPEDILNIFGIELGNNWVYEGTLQGEPYSFEWEVTGIDQSSFPVPTYIYEYKNNGVDAGGEWYENADAQMKLWRTTGEYGGTPINISLSQGLIVAWDSMSVGDHVYSTANTNISGLTFDVSMTVDVISIESISLNFDTVDAFKVQYQLRLWGHGINDITTFTRWIVPYLGVVKEQGSNYILELTSFAIGSGNITYPGDKDEDGLEDFDEFFKFNTHWLIADSDDDGLSDGSEVVYWRTEWNDDPDGDLLINLLDSDSDNDGLSDGMEVNILGTDPSLTDTDNNGISDIDEDTDRDGFSNAEELECGSDPADLYSRCYISLPFLMLLLD